MKSPAFLLIVLGTVLSSLGQEPPPARPKIEEVEPLKADPARDLFDFATLNYNSALEEKDPKEREQAYRSAAKTLDKFIRAFPENEKALDAWYFLGMCYRQIGEDKASRTCFEAAAINWKSGKFVEASSLYLASDAYKSKQWFSAAKWFKIVADTTTNEKIKHESLYRRFLCFSKLEDKENTLLALKTVLADEDTPFNETARLALARFHQSEQSHRQAHEQFTLLASSKKDDIRAEAVLQAALTAQELGDKKLTKEWFEKALRETALKDIRGKTQLALMNLHYADKEWDGVITAFKVGNFNLAKEAQLQRLIMAAKSYDALGKKVDVLKLYEQISKLSPGSASSYQAAYRVLIRDHERKDHNFAPSAESFLKNYAADNPRDPKIHSIRLLLAESYYARKDYQRAIDHYRVLDLTLIDESNALGVRYHVAKTQLSLKNEKGALAAIDAFIKKFPEAKQSTQLRLDRAELLTSKGRETEALDDYQAVLDATGDQKLKRAILLRLAAVYQEKKDWQKFAAMQTKILMLLGLDQKAQASANFWLGWNELRLKKPDHAAPFLRKARILDPKTFTSKVGPLLVRSAYQAENTSLLEKEINLLRKDSPETKLPSTILRWLGATLSKDGHHTRAWPFLDEGLKDKENPASPLIWKLYTQSSLTTDRNEEALKGAESILTLEKNAYRKAEAYYYKSRAHTGIKQFNDARQATSDALDLRPQGELNYRLRTFAGDIDIAQGKPAAALKHYVIVESLYSKSPEEKKEALKKVISTLKAIGTPAALEQLKEYQK